MTESTSINTIPQLTPEQFRAQAQAWLHSPATKLYANGFAIAQSNSDFTLIMLLNGVPTALANMSFISAKTPSEELVMAIKILEETIDQKIPNMNEIAENISRTHSGGGASD